MSSGMRIDPRDLPLHMREQVAVKMLESISKTKPVADRKKETGRKVPVKKYKITDARSAQRYQMLKTAARQGVIDELRVHIKDGSLEGFSYTVVWEVCCLPKDIPMGTLRFWFEAAVREGLGTRIFEPRKGEVTYCG